MVNTLVYKPLVYKGFQWLLYNGTLVNASSEPRSKDRRHRSTTFTLVFWFRFFKDC